ncbi:MAG: taurine catabolism dioxygenase TauD, partial [Thiothrix sp.]|nr:taurine catabolism dioxygenase TauD [Thiothrix sp.]
GSLHMRYSARQKNIHWRTDPATQAATALLLALWEQDSPWKLRHCLQAGEGVLCNNVLHCRTGFVDHDQAQQRRLLYRGRYTDRAG